MNGQNLRQTTAIDPSQAEPAKGWRGSRYGFGAFVVLSLMAF